MSLLGRQFNTSSTEYGFNGKWNEVETGYQNYGMRDYDARRRGFTRIDPLSGKYIDLTPYQFASNSPITGIDLDGLELIQKDNTNYHIDYKPVVHASGVWQGINNASGNAMAFVWNVSLGAAMQGGQKVWNYFAGGYKEKESGGNSVDNFMNATNDIYKYHTKTPAKQQIEDFGNSLTNLTNYEAVTQLILMDKVLIELPISKASSAVVKTELSLAEKIEARQAAAKKFLEKSNVNDIDRHMAAIHFEKEVYPETLGVGAKLYRYSEIGTTNAKHYFFSEDLTTTTPGMLGKSSMYNNPSKYILEEFTLTKPVQVLNSTVDLEGSAGAKQVFSTEIESSSKVRTIKKF